jgi:hypothetical protein
MLIEPASKAPVRLVDLNLNLGAPPPNKLEKIPIIFPLNYLNSAQVTIEGLFAVTIAL